MILASWVGFCFAATPVAEPAKLGDKASLLWIKKLSPEGNKIPAELADLALKVRLDFYSPNDPNKVPNIAYFLGSEVAEKSGRFPWRDILLVNSKPGAENSNGSNKLIQIRAKVTGLKTLIDKNDPRVDTFPVRIYRTFMNEMDDDEAVYTNAFTKLFGKIEKDEKGRVKEPAGREVVLHRLKDILGDDAIYISELIDVSEDKDLNPVKSALPPPPTFAAFDSDVYYTQKHETVGDEEADGWAFAQAMKAQGFVSAGLAHPLPRTFESQRGGTYQFSLSLKDKEILNITAAVSAEEVSDPAVIAKLKALPELARTGSLKQKMKNLGSSKLIGRPITNGSFLVSTGVQKLVVTALCALADDDLSWRFPGITHATDGSADQCLIRAPAQIFFFSGHGWNKDFNGKHEPLLNTYSGDNPTANGASNFAVSCTPYFVNPWHQTAAGVEGNFIELCDKWKKSELRLQWLILLGCQALSRDKDPFKKWSSAAGNFGQLIINELGAKGILGFSEHGFTSASFMSRFVTQASKTSIAQSWLELWHDKEAQAYTWYETNEAYGQSKIKSYAKDLSKIVPAVVVRRENAFDKLTPEGLKTSTGKNIVIFKTAPSDKPWESLGTFRE